MGPVEYVVAAFVALLGYAGYQTIRRRNAEAINQNVEVKNQLNEIDKGISKNQGLADAEASKREELKKQQNDPLKTIKEMEDFLNRSLTDRND